MSRKQIVLDASVAVALVHDEPESQAILATVRRWLSEGAELVVPGHFWLEVINPLARRHGYDSRSLLEALRELDELQITTVETLRPQLILSMSSIDAFGLTAYDAVYLALAQSLGPAHLASTDASLLEAAGALGLDPRADIASEGGHRLAEAPAPYGSLERPVTWPTWPGAGSYLATLRRQAMAGR